jgi:glycosyltransferase involved in cell wall biosynthesis
MRVLEVVEACGAGVGRHVMNLCDGLISEGHEVTVAFAVHRLDEAFRRFIVERSEEIRFFPLAARREISPTSDLRSTAQLLRLIRGKGPFDVIHGHSSKGGGLARIAGRLLGIPTVYTPHSLIMSSPEISRAKSTAYYLIERILGRLATSGLIAVSEEERELILRLGLVRNGSVALIENSLEERDFERFGQTRVFEGLDQKPLTFGSTMRFSPQKGPEQLVEAFILAAESLPHIPMRLVIAGDGELFDTVYKQTKKRGWDKNILLPGWSADPADVLRELDIFVVSSLYEAGLSFSTMEAMAARLPIVSTAVFGTRRTLARVPGNVLVPVGDVEALACGMQRMATLTNLASLRSTLGEIGQTNRSYVREHFMQDDAVHRTVELYRKVCERSSIRPFRRSAA